MKSTDISIAVIIPCFNAEQYLAQTLGSVLIQSRPANEIVVVDDGSTDDSLTIARRFEVAYPDIVKVHSERSGNAPRTRNIGAALTRADALMFLDADDVLAPDALEALAAALAAHPGTLAACPWRRIELQDGKWLSLPATCAPRRADQDALSAWLTGWYYPPCSVLWSREAFTLIGGWDEEVTSNQDGDLVMRALVHGIALTETETGTAYYRKLPQGQTSLSGKRLSYDGLKGRIKVIEKIARMLEESGRIEPYRQSIRRAFASLSSNAAHRYEGLCHYAQMKGDEYAPPFWSRVSTRAADFQRNPAQTRPAALPPRDQVEEIRFGLDLGSQVLEAQENLPKAKSNGWETSVEHPAVSVIIPVYNRAHLLHRTLDGVLQQTFEDFEVLIIDDCSKDDPASVVAAFEDARLRYIRQPENRGVAAARNRGLREARAPFVAFLDDDDEWFAQKLELQVNLLKDASQEVGLVYTGTETVFDEGSPVKDRPSARGDLYLELLIRNILHGAPASALMRRNVITNVGFFDETLPAIEDYDYWLRVCRYYKIECISTPLVRYNDFRAQSDTKQNQERRSLNIKANLDARAQFYKKHGKQMRLAGVAHLFLIDTARRALVDEWSDRQTARRLSLQALLLAPTSRPVHHMLLRSFGLLKARRLIAGLLPAKG
ncbi:glycosyltransferase family 2 protein [Alteromonas lipotrueiana]|uniref:glycosyltransferase family 2 protein n=1 Tax=Alteromonas lipotrueiana TaxID=2803815 RepID=UPI001C47A8E5|nr:glycosyltransferase family A protein [Alteromonas lipotrueiana]